MAVRGHDGLAERSPDGGGYRRISQYLLSWQQGEGLHTFHTGWVGGRVHTFHTEARILCALL